MLKNLHSLGYEQMTEIQEMSLPHTLSNKDLIAKAKTGSGKTAAFGISLLTKLNVKRFRIQGLILCPTRELSDQVAKELRRLARFTHNIKILTLCGGVPFGPQAHSLSHGAHIIVGTAGRILKHLGENNLNLDDVHTLVLDEADRMLDMGFNEDIMKIVDEVPSNRQTLLFSATYPDQIQDLSSSIMKNPIEVSVDAGHDEQTIQQHFYETTPNSKTAALGALISNFKAKSVVMFCNTKIMCDDLADDLYDLGFDCLVLHSDLDQRDRNETLVMFANKSYPILIATDVAARGLDIKDIDLVINYDLALDPEVHVHRIGRTARAGAQGVAVTLVNEYENEKFEDLIDYLDQDFKLENITDVADDINYKLQSSWTTLFINGGKKKKVRAGDILGALTRNVGLDKDDVGKIDIFEHCSYVAIKNEVADKSVKGLEDGKIKGRFFRVFKK